MRFIFPTASMFFISFRVANEAAMATEANQKDPVTNTLPAAFIMSLVPAQAEIG
jgi:hypothetical protein